MPVIQLSRRLWREVSRDLRAHHARREAERRLQRREVKRREQLVLKHMPMVTRIAKQVWRTMTHITVEELISDGYLGLVKAAHRYQPGAGEFEHFAYFLVRGAMVDAHKRRAYRDETHDSLDAIHERLGFLPARLDRSAGPLPDELAWRREERRLLAAAVDELPADEKRVILAALGGTPLCEIAAECERSVAWARTKLAGAREQLTAVLRPMGRAA